MESVDKEPDFIYRYCKHCGLEMDSEDTYCPGCGFENENAYA